MYWLVESIKAFGNKNSIIHNNMTYTYNELYEKIIHYLQKIVHIPKGSVIIILSDYSINSIALLLALVDRREEIFNTLNIVKNIENGTK